MKHNSRQKTNSMSVVLLEMLLLVFFVATIRAEEPLHAPDITERPTSSKPFWIDKGMFTSENWLFVVGVATGSTQEQARSKSLDTAKRELTGHLKNYSDMQGLETKELWEEKNTLTGAFTTYRLMVMKLRDWTPLLIDKSKVEEVANILARIEERKAKEATDAEKTNAEQMLIKQRAEVLHMNIYETWKLGDLCARKDVAIQHWQYAQSDEGREYLRKDLNRGLRGLAFSLEHLRGGNAKAALEQAVNFEIDERKREAESRAMVCEKLKEADVLIAKEEQKKADDPLKRLRYWEERLWKERFPKGHPAGAEAEAEAFSAPSACQTCGQDK